MLVAATAKQRPGPRRLGWAREMSPICLPSCLPIHAALLFFTYSTEHFRSPIRSSYPLHRHVLFLLISQTCSCSRTQAHKDPRAATLPAFACLLAFHPVCLALQWECFSFQTSLIKGHAVGRPYIGITNPPHSTDTISWFVCCHGNYYLCPACLFATWPIVSISLHVPDRVSSALTLLHLPSYLYRVYTLC
ncbi:hypothetical protein GGI43DRAFT_140192 [Trichoderma evansii]